MTVIVSNYPTVTITYPGVPATLLARKLAAVNTGVLSLFGTRLAPATVSYGLSLMSPGATSANAAATFTPNILSVPFLEQTAPVIGAVIGE